MKIEDKATRVALRNIRKSLGTRMKFVRAAYSEFGTDYVAVEKKVIELHEAQLGTLIVPTQPVAAAESEIEAADEDAPLS